LNIKYIFFRDTNVVLSVMIEFPALSVIRKNTPQRFRTLTSPSSLCSNSSQVGIAAITMAFSIVHEIPSAPRLAKEKHVPFLSIKQPGSGGRRQTMPGHYRLPGLLARHSLFVLTPVSEFVFTSVCVCTCVRTCVRACDPHVLSVVRARSTVLHTGDVHVCMCAKGTRAKGEKYKTRGGKEGKVVGLPFQN